MPDIVILPSKKEMEQLRRLLIRYRDNEIDEYEIENLITSMLAETFRLAKVVVKFTED
jgi:hypothetical protein